MDDANTADGALAPMAFTVFSLQPAPSRADTIAFINRFVNLGIIADRRDIPLAKEVWSIGPVRGQCHDYSVTKQWLLAAFGIAGRLCECVAPDNEHHMVLLVDDVALDNITPVIGPMRYPVVRSQSAHNPQFWEAPATS